ncbi:MAG: hypothetical protein CUN51_06355 [Candidatus Thermofonsia Clade 1 bacterium]|uniref:Uncharacterized protein n=1 Tax=Candidatus Thermofonsia Clade 1 bacterium TaxID=2364210 RepID=A0A2M8NZS8_9CHLR|nr:MAG: hypothetical protein CUN51_06355 [Candidatus Thermofonsia Clade 1 bacterium]
MANEVRNQLKQAYAYIQQERLDQALTILRRVLSNAPDNADAWWLMANAVSEPADAANALNNVLRLRPDHAEAQQAYQQLIAEYPEFAPSQATEPAFDMSDFNIDDLLDRSPTPDATSSAWMPAEDNFGATAWSVAETSGSSSDFDALFGGRASVDVPVTATEDDDLTALFGVRPEPRSATRERAPEMPSDLDWDAPTSPVPYVAESPADLDALFSASPESQVSAEPQVAPEAQDAAEPARSQTDLDADLDAIFGGEPAFVGQIAQQEEKQRGRRGRRRKEPQPTTFEEAYGEAEPAAPTEPLEPAPERPRRTKPQRLAPEQPAYDPFEAERRANKRSPVWALLSLLIAIGVLGALVLVVVPSLAPDAVTQALRNAQQSLADRGFEQTAADRAGDVFRLTVCGNAGRALQGRVYEAMELVADHVAAVSDVIKSVQLTVVDCADTAVILFRATAPVEAVRRYLEGNRLDVRTYRASWQ